MFLPPKLLPQSSVFWGRMRSGLSLAVGAAILIALAQAPFHHVHEQVHEQHEHQGISAHLHQPRQAGDEVAFRSLDPNSDARLLNWFQAVERANHAIDVPPLSSVLTVPERLPELVTRPLVPRAHDPPATELRPSRAPPTSVPAFRA